ncbi:FecR family protein [Spirosoma sordidisoli]|uniref:FecR family protein n=1 Tax=Spirosoma sordidisoli TaxID=2502893 RepID=A0A4Q2UTH0_9BACT|nr:FecR family protein [Spirosoma sordidisoli]RYC70119.1 FecR family protein [Spirosoma sordidisoli]
MKAPSDVEKYQQYTVKQFVLDPSFRRWVLFPDDPANIHWADWVALHPEKAADMASAKSLVLAIRPANTPLSATERAAAVQQIMARLPDTVDSGQPRRIVRQIHWQSWLRVAAAILLITGAGWWFIQRPNRIDYAELVAQLGQTRVEQTNDTQQPRTVLLSDGSTVTLQPGSRISYPVSFRGNQREVVLQGEAFFSIAKNPVKPFVVYANELVTKVLGTSFWVRARQQDEQVQVTVKTGRVAVFSQADPQLSAKLKAPALDGVVLDPNQRIVYTRATEKMEKGLIEQPLMTGQQEHELQAFNFDETPVAQVFETLEKAYEIDLVYDPTLFRDCPVSANLTDLPLYEKLDLICKAVQARYVVIEGRIIIEGKGCSVAP